MLQHHVQDVCILLSNRGKINAIDNGQVLFSYFFKNPTQIPPPDESHIKAVKMYKKIENEIVATEQIYSIVENRKTFHVFVPFVPKGEYMGVLYMKNTPEFGFITTEIISSYNETSIIFTALILFGLLAMFFISSYTVQERDETQKLLYDERERQLKEQLNFQKETLFAKRIYHTHHKAEKVMGFIKEDLVSLDENNIEEIKYRVAKYANFVSRVIYDMKWYDPPIQTIRNPFFKTDLNELIQFIVENIFLRISTDYQQYQFEFDLGKNLPLIHVNEFVIWEIFEPLIQNSIEHGGDEKITIQIKTQYFSEENKSVVTVSDNGVGIKPELLEKNEQGIKKIFLENVSTKEENQKSAGYGCYIAYEIATQRCGWEMDAKNLKDGGCEFTIVIHQG